MLALIINLDDFLANSIGPQLVNCVAIGTEVILQTLTVPAYTDIAPSHYQCRCCQSEIKIQIKLLK